MTASINIRTVTVELPKTSGIALEETLNCGQCFRWRLQPDGGWSGVVGHTALWVKRQGESLLCRSTSIPQASPQELSALCRQYFDLETDYQAIRTLCGCHPVLSAAASFAGGIHILRQDPWEALCTFILSQNNNIKRISGLIDRLCKYFGEPISNLDGTNDYAFPTPERLASLKEEDLSPVRSGFRAKYVLDAARKVASGEILLSPLSDIQTPTKEAADILMGIRGVGPKVAQCALLFGCHKLDCLPRDVWIGRAMDALFPDGFPQEILPIAGIAQQYLFHYVRHHPEILAEKGEELQTKQPILNH